MSPISSFSSESRYSDLESTVQAKSGSLPDEKSASAPSAPFLGHTIAVQQTPTTVTNMQELEHLARFFSHDEAHQGGLSDEQVSMNGRITQVNEKNAALITSEPEQQAPQVQQHVQPQERLKALRALASVNDVRIRECKSEIQNTEKFLKQLIAKNPKDNRIPVYKAHLKQLQERLNNRMIEQARISTMIKDLDDSLSRETGKVVSKKNDPSKAVSGDSRLPAGIKKVKGKK